MPKKLHDKLVLDSNIIVSSALNAKFEEIIALKVVHKIEIYTCAKQIAELERTLIKLTDKLKASPEYYTSSFEQLSNLTEIDERFDRSPDPKDNYLFDLAYQVKSYYLITGEKALLNMKQVNQIKIISMVEFRKTFKDLL